MISHLPIGVIGPKVLSSSAVTCIEASGEGSKEAENLLSHLLLAVVTMVFVGPLKVGRSLVGRIGIKSSVVPVWGWWPFAVRLLMRHDVWVTSDDPERNDILRLEDDVRVTFDDPERNDILRLEEMKSRKSMLINAY